MFKRWLNISADKSILLIGPRRSGKTTYLKNNFSDFKYSTLLVAPFLSWKIVEPLFDQPEKTPGACPEIV